MTQTSLAQRFADAMGQLLGPAFPSDIGLAVSGGGDSMAMLSLAHNWTREYGVRLWVVTVDHGLRPESASEARFVAGECADLGWPHATLHWHWDGRGNLQDAARRARLALIDRWRGDLRHVLFAHTRDDQAETVLMRLARGSGVDGLAGMRSAHLVAPHPGNPPVPGAADVIGRVPPRTEPEPGFHVLRPCLDLGRDELRHHLRVLHGRWVDDPSNDDRAYDRVRMRHVLQLLAEDGITADGLAQTARRLARARDGLKARLVETVGSLCRDAPRGQVRIDRDGLARLDAETQLRLLTQALRYAASSEYRPRAAASEALLARVLAGAGGTLQGAEVLVGKTELRVIREASAVQPEAVPLGGLWDDQWVLTAQDGDFPAGATVSALGDHGWRQIAPKGPSAVPHRASLALPAIWSGQTLLACPGLGFGPHVKVIRYVLGQVDAGFEAFCLSH